MKKPYTPKEQQEMLELWHEIFVRNKAHSESLWQAVHNMQKFHHLGKKYSTFLRELNPTDVGAKLGAAELFLLMHYFDDVRPLEDWAKRLGYKLVRANEASIASMEQKALIKLVGIIPCKKCPARSGCVLQYNDVSTYSAGDCVSEIIRALEGPKPSVSLL